jgi:hypothetical protein
MIYQERNGEKPIEKIFVFSLRVGMRVKIKALQILCAQKGTGRASGNL